MTGGHFCPWPRDEFVSLCVATIALKATVSPLLNAQMARAHPPSPLERMGEAKKRHIITMVMRRPSLPFCPSLNDFSCVALQPNLVIHANEACLFFPSLQFSVAMSTHSLKSVNYRDTQCTLSKMSN